jgi:hypothetical protein
MQKIKIIEKHAFLKEIANVLRLRLFVGRRRRQSLLRVCHWPRCMCHVILWRGPEARPETELATHARTNQLFAVLGLRNAADRIAALAVSLLQVHVRKPLPKVVLIVLLVDQRFKKCLPEPLPQFLFSWGLSWPSSWGRRQRPSGVYG